ncbi:hypothetical protein [Paraburkholderia pallida]|uniref:hypothetical protein n=1 Tax=Paraburkholderia pallida TaxID=2547399 RepID=UPI001E32C32F|nr:hypothetical protein [Paraburkholderia pallida]
METDSTPYAGLDVHEVTVTYALGEDELPGKIVTTKADIDRLRKRLQSKAITCFLERGANDRPNARSLLYAPQ